MHYDRETILNRYRHAVPFTVELGPDDTAWDPETGDSLLGPATITYDLGTFPGLPRTATVIRVGDVDRALAVWS